VLKNKFTSLSVIISGVIGMNLSSRIVEGMIMKDGWKENVSCVIKERKEIYNV